MKRPLSSFALHFLLLLGALITIVPLIWMVSASFMPEGEANSEPPPFFPSKVTFENYAELFTRLNLGRGLFNSAILAASITLISLFLNSMAGYAFARMRFPGRSKLFSILLAGLVIPAQVAMLPLFLMLRRMGLVNSYWGVIIPGMATILGIFLVRQYALSLPDDLLDAARVDGASEFRIYWSIVLPLCKPVLITLAVLTFLTAWNDFLWPLIVLTDESKYTLPVALASLSGEHVHDTELMMAGSVVTVLPVILIFLALQRYYISGIMQGSVKE